jgi:hypothetical protein
LLILNERIFDSNVEREMPSRTAAPAGPLTRPRQRLSVRPHAIERRSDLHRVYGGVIINTAR